VETLYKYSAVSSLALTQTVLAEIIVPSLAQVPYDRDHMLDLLVTMADDDLLDQALYGFDFVLDEHEAILQHSLAVGGPVDADGIECEFEEPEVGDLTIVYLSFSVRFQY
jgi:hypothetical protein